MSRSIRGEKGPNFTFWTKRPGDRSGEYFNRSSQRIYRRLVHKRDRQLQKKECYDQVRTWYADQFRV